MTTKTDEQERADFEAWADKRGLNLHKVTPCDGSEPYYADSAGPTAWAAWNARAALQAQDRGDGGEWMRRFIQLLDEFQAEAASYGHPCGTERRWMDQARAEIIDHARRIEGET